jgi:hypothetical protein
MTFRPGAVDQSEATRAIGADDGAVGSHVQVNRGMAERTAAAVAVDDASPHPDDLVCGFVDWSSHGGLSPAMDVDPSDRRMIAIAGR